MKCRNYAVVIVYMVYSNADTLSLQAYRSGTKLENTSLSTDGKQGSALEYTMGTIRNLSDGNVQYRQKHLRSVARRQYFAYSAHFLYCKRNFANIWKSSGRKREVLLQSEKRGNVTAGEESHLSLQTV